MHVYMYISVYTVCTCIHTEINRYKQIKHSFTNLNNMADILLEFLNVSQGLTLLKVLDEGAAGSQNRASFNFSSRTCYIGRYERTSIIPLH